MPKRKLRYAISVDEITDRALETIARREDRTKSSLAYKILKTHPDVDKERRRIYKNIYGVDYVDTDSVEMDIASLYPDEK